MLLGGIWFISPLVILNYAIIYTRSTYFWLQIKLQYVILINALVFNKLKTHFLIFAAQLWRYLCQFAHAKLKSEHLLSYIQQAHFDSKRQLCIKDFFCFNKKKSEKTSPSTSSHSANRDVDVVDGINSNSEDLESDIIDASPVDDRELDSDVDIIDSSQKEQQIKRQLPIASHQFKKDSNINLHKMQEDICHLADEIDGDFKKPDEGNLNAKSSLVLPLDEYAKMVKHKDVIINMPEEPEVQQMDVDEAEIEASSKCSSSNTNNTSKNNESTSKQKITDYFIKIDKG